MMLYTVIALVLTVLYVIIFLCYLLGWLTLPVFPGTEAEEKTQVSIIIPARNEEKNIGNLLSDLLEQTYAPSLFEIIVVDDFSTDDTSAMVKSFEDTRIRLFHMQELINGQSIESGHKKKALELGIEKASGELIITTDADCRMGKVWLKTIVGFFELKRCHMIAAPVLFTGEENFFERMQSLDFLGMIGITGATLQLNFAALCNGANLAFQKRSFAEVNGYAGVDGMASGDDVLLMHKMARQWRKGVLFLKNKNAVVYTFPQRSFKSFVSQRLRWTSKSKHYKDAKVAINLLIVYLFNLCLLITLVLSFTDDYYLLLFTFQLVLKLIMEFSFLSQVAKFFDRQKLLSLFLPAQLFHVLYIVVVGVLGNFLKPAWKGRRIT